MEAKMIRAAIAAICAAAALPSLAGQNLIVNGAFEDEGTYMPRISSRANGTYAYYSDGQGFNASPWTFTGTAGLCVSNSAFLGGIYATVTTSARMPCSFVRRPRRSRCSM